MKPMFLQEKFAILTLFLGFYGQVLTYNAENALDLNYQ